MDDMIRYTLLCAALCLLAAVTRAQTIQDCAGAIPVCQNFYSQSSAHSGSGSIPNEINTSISCTAGELNSVWYTFTTTEAGLLGFVITPNNLNDDYDWALFNITNASCAQIATNPALQVSCNASGGTACHGPTGANGGSVFNVQGAGCNSNPPSQSFGFSPFNARVPVQAGNTYVLMVSNWSGSPFGYTLDFSSSTGLGIFDQTPPAVLSLETPQSCAESTIAVEFSEPVRCNTVSSANFALAGPGGPYTVALAPGCVGNNNTSRDFTLNISPPINSTGSYTLSLITDGTSQVMDLCSNAALSADFGFEVSVPIVIPVNMGGDTALLCDGNTAVLSTTTIGIEGTYLWDNGSTESIRPVTAAGVYSVTVTNSCGTGEASQEIIVLNDPPMVNLGADPALCFGETLTLDAANPFSTYLWQDGSSSPTFTIQQAGTYTVAVTNACGTVSDALTALYAPSVSLDLGADIVLCEGQTTTLSVLSPTATYLWQDGSTEATYTVTEPGLYSVTVATLCESRSDEVEVVYITPEGPMLGADTVICPGASLTIDFGIPGATYLWQDGSTAPVYTISQSGYYRVQITTSCNTSITSQEVFVLDSIATELGRDTFLCPGEELRLDASAGTLAEYKWSDGSANATLRVREPGVYSVSVSNLCEVVEDQVTVQPCEACPVYVPNVFSPNGDGINDVFLPYSACALTGFTFLIFDRWGSQVYATTDPAKGWNGLWGSQNIPTGTYIWKMTYTVLENNRPRQVERHGDVALMR